MGCEDRLVLSKIFDRAQKLAFTIRFQEVAARPSLQTLLHECLVVVNGKDQDFCVGYTRLQDSGRVNAVDQGHGIVKHGYVRPGFNGFDYGLSAVASLSDYIPAHLTLKDPAESCAYDLVVVCNEDAYHGNAGRQRPGSKHFEVLGNSSTTIQVPNWPPNLLVLFR